MTFADNFRGEFIADFIASGMLVPCQIVRKTPGVFNPATGKTGPATETLIDAHGVVETVTTRALNGVLTISANTLSAQTRITITREAKVGDTIKMNGSTFTVKEIATTNPDQATPIIFEVLV